MAHQIHHTRGVILGSSPAGESSRFYKIFTEELGLVGAKAQSVREGKSKLRYVLQDFSWVHVDLVRGKEVWRITSAQADSVHTYEGALSVKSRKIFARACGLVARLVQGELRDQNLFHELSAFSAFLVKSGDLGEQGKVAEAIMALRVLAHLGYLEEGTQHDAISFTEWSLPLLDTLAPRYSSMVVDINTALRASHL